MEDQVVIIVTSIIWLYIFAFFITILDSSYHHERDNKRAADILLQFSFLEMNKAFVGTITTKYAIFLLVCTAIMTIIITVIMG